MSILDALKTFKQERESIDDIAALPQALIMQMAQKGQIPKTDVPMILARKAEIAQTQAQMNALRQQQSQGAAPTLMEKMIAVNAQQETPREMTDVGIASNPVPEMRMAGGGIVAFAEGDLVKEMSDEERAEYIKNNPYLQRSQSIASIPAGFTDFIRKYNPVSGTAYREGIKNFISESPESQGTRFRSYSQNELQRGNPNKPFDVADVSGYMRGDDTAIPEAKIRKVNPVAVAEKQQPDLVSKVAANKKAVAEQTLAPKEKLFSEYEKMLMDEREAAKGAREEAKWARLMEAGLNIMGGESPYAFANIGKGAAAAAKGYGEDVKGLRAEERDRIKQLAALSAKREELGVDREKLGITKQHYDDWARLESNKINIMRQQNIDAKISADVEKNFATLMNFYKADIDKGDINPSDLYQQAQRNVGSTRGKDIGSAGNLPTSNTLSWSSLNKGK